MKLGYARVSTDNQSLDIQIERLQTAGVSKDLLFTDKASGKNDNRKGLQKLLQQARSGEEIVITKLDRLGRNTSDMIAIIEELSERNIDVTFLDDGISTKGSMGKMVVTILAAVAQAERERILERTNEGRKRAIANGVKMGRKVDIGLHSRIRALLTDGLNKAAIAKELGCSRQTVYNAINHEIA